MKKANALIADKTTNNTHHPHVNLSTIGLIHVSVLAVNSPPQLKSSTYPNNRLAQ
jgi:hypothetical protein